MNPTLDLENSAALSPTAFVELLNEHLAYEFGSVLVTGEVASFKVNQGKWVFFDLKDENSSVSCFMPVWDLRMPVEDGMKVVVRATPKLTRWGKFSLTVQTLKPVGEGSLKKAFELLKRKLTAEGLFAAAKKRPIPRDFKNLGIISSTAAAGYADFLKILGARWGGIHIQVAHTQVQGLDAPDQIIRALHYFNERGEVEVIAILRGGGSADDLSCFNDERLVRAIAASKIPVITGIGHEIDESLADLAADLAASTPSNAAELLTRDRKAVIAEVRNNIFRLGQVLENRISGELTANSTKIARTGNALIAKYIDPMLDHTDDALARALDEIRTRLETITDHLRQKSQLLAVLNPENILKQGYAILSGDISIGNVVKITTNKRIIKAQVKEIYDRSEN